MQVESNCIENNGTKERKWDMCVGRENVQGTKYVSVTMAFGLYIKTKFKKISVLFHFK